MRTIVRNWEETARYFLYAMRGNYLADGTTERGALLNRLLGYPDARALYEIPNTPPSSDHVASFHSMASSCPPIVTLEAMGVPLLQSS